MFGLILTRAEVNGRAATLVVDTGSNHTVLSSGILSIRPLALENTVTASKGSGYTGRAAWTKATLEIGPTLWRDQRVLVMDDFQDLSASLKQKVDGILGADLLREFEFVIMDFKHHRLMLVR